jgi:IS30 family transposase
MPRWAHNKLPTSAKKRYFELLREGCKGAAAARVIGVSTSCGSNWFLDAGGMIVPDFGPISPRFLTQDERIAIADGLQAGRSKKEIAASIGKSFQTVYREIRRNSMPDGRYQPWWAHNQALLRRQRPKTEKIRDSRALRTEVRHKLTEKWSPQQVSRFLTRTYPGQPAMQACPETIYRALFAGQLGRRPGKAHPSAQRLESAPGPQRPDPAPAQLRKTLTWDQGREMTLHEDIAAVTGFQIFFCDPHSPWQRGTNENTNGLLRQYFPKGTDLSVHTAQHLRDVARQLNNRPRLVLNDKTPTETMRALLIS